MRRTIPAMVLVLGALAMVVPQAAFAETHTFNASVPCTVVCPYWTLTNEDTCRTSATEPVSPPGSWDDWRVTIPSGYTGLQFEIVPVVDFDSWLCHDPTDPGPGNTYFISSGANLCCPDCSILGAFGCDEQINYCIHPTDDACLQPGDKVIFRVYNWLDPNPSVVGSLDFLT